jgi:signal transduction histidine kinase
MPEDTETRLGNFTELVATAIANAEAHAALTASRSRIIVTADETRRRIERDLHDGAQQRLVAVALRVRAAQAAVPSDLPQLVTELDDAATELTGALDELRDFARGIHPAMLAKGGLRPALRTLASRSAVPVDLDVRTNSRLPELVEVAAYYVVSEALTNAAKHAQASRVTVRVEVVGDLLRVGIRDDGVGGAHIGRGSGLVGLKDRVDALGGRVTLQSEPGAGTSLSIELPLANAARGIEEVLL